MIEDMKSSDVDEVVEIHIVSFPDSFLTNLGRLALNKLYEEFGSKGFAYVYRDSGKVLGVMAGTCSTVEKFYQDLIKKYFFHFALILPVAIVKRPVLIKRIFIRMKRLFQKPDFESFITEPEYDVVMNSKCQNAYALMLGVSPLSRGKGVGKKLWVHQLHDLPKRGVDAILASVDSNNDITNGFYQRMGFKKIAQTKRKNFDLEFRWLAYWKDHCQVTDTGKIEWIEEK